MCLSPPRLTLGAEESVFMDPHGSTVAPKCPAVVKVYVAAIAAFCAPIAGGSVGRD